MRILSIHNSYKIRGGEEESCEAEEHLLERMGHQVDRYWESNTRIDNMNLLHAAVRATWSSESHQIVKHMLAKDLPDIVHVQNFFPMISPSIYYAAKTQNLPVVQTLRNYRLLCPNALFFRQGQSCEACLRKPIPWVGVAHSCYKQSMAATGAVAAMLTIHRALGTWNRMIDVYVTLTQFAREKFIEGGLPAHKIVVKPNFVYPDPQQELEKQDFVLFVGRLTVEKGIDTLLSAWQHLDKRIPLKVVGEGPLQPEIIKASQRFPWIEWLGPKPLEEVYALMGKAKLLIFPSKWYETFGRVAIEAFAKGTPVIASNLGAIAEIVDHGRTGLHFQPGNGVDLANQIDWAFSNSGKLVEMGKEARLEFEAKYTAEDNYKRLMEIYQTVLK